MDRKNLRGSLLLLLGAMIWGFAFVVQRIGMDSMQPVSFNGIRNLLAGLCLFLVSLLPDRVRGRRGGKPDHVSGPLPVSSADPSSAPVQVPLSGDSPGLSGSKSLSAGRQQLLAGLLCGVFLFLASTLQQMGLVDTSAGKAGFITALYVVLVPVTAFLLFRKNPGRWIWLSVAMAVVGLFLLCVPIGEQMRLNRGDLLVLGCAFCFTGQILAVDAYAPRVDPIRLSRDEFLISGILGILLSLFCETITLEGIRNALPAILYAGIVSGAIGYTLQILGQRDTNPTLASLLMCLESVFSVLSGALVLGERMTGREALGCVIMFSAVILAQLSPLLHRRKAGS